MKYNLFLDDFRVPSDAFWITYNTMYNKLKWEIVRDFDEFKEFVEKHGKDISIISFDHDLADSHYIYGEPDYNQCEEKTGYHCAIWFCDYFLENISKYLTDFPKTFCHSQNIIGKDNIEIYIRNFKRHSLK